MKLTVTKDDDFLYEYLLKLLQQVKLVQGGTALASTLRRHSRLKAYMIAKQIQKITYIEDTFFDDKGLNQLAIEAHLHKYPLQKNLDDIN